MLFALCACNNPEPVETATPSPESTADTYTPVTFRNNGKRAAVSAMPEKILAVGPNCTEVLCALGLADKIIGKCMTNHSKGALKELADAYDSVPVLCKGYPTLDQIVESGCDFVYASSWLFDKTLTAQMLEDRGITVYVNEADDYNSLWEEITDLGNIFCVQDAAEEIIAEQTAAIEAISAVIYKEEAVKVLVLDSFIGDKLYTAGGTNIETEYIASAGGVNVFAELDDAWDAVTVDDVIAANPDYIIIHDYSNSSYADKVKALQEDEQLQYLDCVRNSCFIKLPLTNVMPGMRSAVTVEKLANKMFAELFTVAETAQPK